MFGWLAIGAVSAGGIYYLTRKPATGEQLDFDGLVEKLRLLNVRKPQVLSKPYPGPYYEKIYDDGNSCKIYEKFGKHRIYYYPEFLEKLKTEEWDSLHTRLHATFKELGVVDPAAIERPYPGPFYKKTYDDGETCKIYQRPYSQPKVYFYPEYTETLQIRANLKKLLAD